HQHSRVLVQFVLDGVGRNDLDIAANAHGGVSANRDAVPRVRLKKMRLIHAADDSSDGPGRRRRELGGVAWIVFTHVSRRSVVRVAQLFKSDVAAGETLVFWTLKAVDKSRPA